MRGIFFSPRVHAPRELLQENHPRVHTPSDTGIKNNTRAIVERSDNIQIVMAKSSLFVQVQKFKMIGFLNI